MIVYHIDRDNCLKEGQMINLIQSHNNLLLKKKMFPEGISKHGIHYLSDEFQNIGGNRPEYYVMEYEIELVRRCYFPDSPSRFQSLFAFKSLSHLEMWNDIFPQNTSIWEIEIDEDQYLEMDASLLIPALSIEKEAHTFSPENSFFYGYKYWEGCKSVNPKLELLISLKKPVKVIKKIG